MNCLDAIYGNEYFDFIMKNMSYYPSLDEGICALDGGENFTILFVPSDRYPPLTEGSYNYSAIPKCYTPLSLEALAASGILEVRDLPSLALDGSGVLIGFLDTGIDVNHPAFLDEAGNSRIVAVWNQNYQEEMGESQETSAKGIPPVYYGRVYSGESLLQYGNGDADGHGTYVASVAAGSIVGNHSGAAPKADIAMVHLKDAKPYLKDFYFIPQDRLCFQENDIMLGIQFLNALALSRKQSLVLCMSVGCSMGSHSGNSPLGQYVDRIATIFRRCVVCGSGNEAASERHFYGKFLEQITERESDIRQQEEYMDVEIVVGEDVCGFVMEQWTEEPTNFQIAMISPAGNILPKTSAQLQQSQEHFFPLEGTRVMLFYSMPETTTGNQLIYYRIETPSPGIWRVRVYEPWREGASFHMYLAQSQLQCGDVQFLVPNPDVTVVEPGNASRVLTVGGYNQRQNSVYLESGRGYTMSGRLKPELAAPAVEVDGAVAGTAGRPRELQYALRTGTSGAVAIGAGAAAMYMQWCDRQMDYRVNTLQVKTFLIRGTQTFPGDLYPNRLLGYGVMDLYESFERL